MRFVIKKYANGKTVAFETTDDGGSVVKEIEGATEVGARISAFVELAADENARGVDNALESLNLLTDLVKQKQQKLAQPQTAKP